MKKHISILISIIIAISSFPLTAFGSDNDSGTKKYSEIISEYDEGKSFIDSIILTEDEDNFELDGNEMPIHNEKLTVVDDTAMVSIEFLCKYIDAEYTNDTKASTGYSTIEFEDREVWFNETTGAIDIIDDYNDNIVLLDKLPFTKNNDIMVPLEEFSEALGYEVTQEDEHYLLTRPYQTSRLLVTSTRKIDPLNSVAEFKDKENDITILQFDSETDTIEAKEYYESLKGVTVEPDTIVSTCEDSKVETNLFDLETYDNHRETAASELIHIDEMNDYLATQKLNDVLVAVVDTGVCSSHPDLKDRVTCADVNFSDSEQTDSEDDQGHGTHVAGIIADNTLDNVKILSVKALGNDGKGTIYQVYQAMNYAVEQGAKVINLSLGQYGDSDLMKSYVKTLWKNNITVVASAGNEQWFAHSFTPARIPECITVGAIDNNKINPSFSNTGYPIDIDAPGVDIYSTWIFDDTNDGYKYASGTSMSAPFVSATAISLYSYNDHYSAEYIHDRIKDLHQKGPHSKGSGSFINGVPWTYGILDCSNLIEVERTATPTISVKGGNYLEPKTLVMSCEDSDARIYYTTDGTIASETNGTLYTEPFTIDGTMRIHLVAYADGKFKSFQTYYDYNIVVLLDESHFTINNDGIITHYSLPNEDVNSITIPETINGITVTGIDNGLFSNDETLKMLVLPDTCKTIGDNAFDGCINLIGVRGMGVERIGEYTFRYCRYLQAFQNEKLTTMGKYAFYYCYNLKHIDSPYIQNVPEYAFSECWGLLQVKLENAINIEKYAFYRSLKLAYAISDSVKHIADHAFDSTRITSAIFRNVETVGEYAFQRCSSLRTISLDNYSGEIPRYLCSGCDELINVNIPNATAVRYCAFESCEHLKELVLNKATIVENALPFADALTKVEFNSAKSIAGFSNINAKVLSFPNCEVFSSLTSDTLEYLYLPKCKQIKSYIKAPNLKYAYLPELTTIGAYKEHPTSTDRNKPLFKDCFSIEEINLPKLDTVYGKVYAITDSSYASKCKIKRIYAPIISNRGSLFSCMYNIKLYLDLVSDLPEQTSDTTLTFDIKGLSPTFEWYYSQDGSEDTFVKIPGAESMTYSPTQEGYYYAIVSKVDNKIFEQIRSKTCHYSYNSQESTNKISIKGSEKFKAYIDNTLYTAEKTNNKYEINTEAKQNSIVFIICDKDNFEAWIDNHNRIKSINKNYSFTISSDTELTAKFRTEGTVDFFNGDKNNDLISSDIYTEFSEKDFPAAPEMYGYHFVGWSMTADEIDRAVKNGESVEVHAVFSKQMKYYSVTVYGGTVRETNSDDENGKDSYNEFSTITIYPGADLIDSFICWKDTEGNVLSYYPDYEFIVSADIEIVAIYGDSVQAEAITRITNAVIDKDTNKITFIAEREIPENCEVVSHGIIMTDDAALDDETFIIGAANVLKGTSVTTGRAGTYTLYKSNVQPGDTWYARSYIIYRTKNGNVITKYSNIYSATME